MYAKKLESLGRAEFEWPLSDEDRRTLRQQMPVTQSNKVLLYCRACALKLIRSEKIEV